MAITQELAAIEVKLEVFADGQPRSAYPARTSQQPADAGGQLGPRDRLREDLVDARFECRQAFGFRAPRGDVDDSDVGTRLVQRLHRRQAGGDIRVQPDEDTGSNLQHCLRRITRVQRDEIEAGCLPLKLPECVAIRGHQHSGVIPSSLACSHARDSGTAHLTERCATVNDT